ncbi:MAG TPA: ABC transporter ATP-binding protein [Nevskiaceae bacterium]|nr:ABC transporter ATP-binding protein [Nevskiaceae bacterium]
MDPNEEYAVSVQNISKAFRLPHERQTSIKSVVVNAFKKKSYEKQQVLKNIEFDIKKGEFFGITGRNGSGKSTLLKLMAGIYSPDKGRIAINGKLTPFIELGVGFNPELTGRENVFLNGALLGFNRKEMLAMYDDIVSFAELGRFMDQKLKNYSSGMQVRLAFSIAIRAQSDILLIDEVLAVGDVNFQAKSIAVFEEIKKRGTTVIFVSHDMEAVRRFCDRVALIEKGKVVNIGEAQKVIDDYLDLNAEATTDKSTPFGVSNVSTRDESKLQIVRTRVLNQNLKPATKIGDDSYSLEVTVKFKAKCDDCLPGVVVRNQSGIRVTASNTEWARVTVPTFAKGDVVTFRFTFPNVLEHGTYFVSSNAASQKTKQFYDWDNDAARMIVTNKDATGGVVNPEYNVTITKA